MSDQAFEQLLDQAQGGSPAAQYDLAQHYIDQQEFGRARRWFGRAARNGHARAWSQLGLLELRGLGLSPDAAEARRHFESAAAAGDPEGRYQLALMAFRRGTPPEEVFPDLLEAARSGHPGAQRELGVLHLATDPETGRGILSLAAHQDDRIAQSLLARLWADGVGGPADSRMARAWATRAAANGSYCRKRFEPLGGDDQAPDGTSDLDAATLPMPALESTLPPPQHPTGDERVTVWDHMLAAWECEYLMEAAAPLLRPSHTVHPETGEPVHNEMRTSFGCSFHPTDEDFVILNIKRRLAAQTHLPVEHAEPFALLRYEPGQEYKSHWDFIDPRSGEAGRELERFGQRQVTIFSYLTDVAEGGETEFVRREVKVAPRQGRVLMFQNTLPDGRPDEESLHASLPVTSGEKWIATLWMRDKVYAR